MVLSDSSVEPKIHIDGGRLEHVVYSHIGKVLDERGTQGVEIKDGINKTIKLYFAMTKLFMRSKRD